MKKINEEFDVTMGAFDGAEICELVGLFLLSEISKKYNKDNVGLYRDDGLAIFRDINGHQADKIRKNVYEIFKKHDLKLEIQCNLKIINFLDITLDLNNGTYKPYRKPNDEAIYVHAKSNHPKNITKQLPISIETRLSQLSSNNEIFDEAAKYYQDVLNKCGYEHKLKYHPPNPTDELNNKSKPNRKRKIIWFNPPYSKNVCTNVGHYFLNLIEKHFPENHKYRKIFNKNNLKISYSCMQNIKSIINAHNRKIIYETNDLKPQGKCNCINKSECPLNNECQETNIVYI